MPNKETEKQYSELRKRLKIPEFREMDNEFELSDLEETSFLLRAVIGRITEKIDFYASMLAEVLQPDTSNPHSMHETRFFDENEKKQMYALYSSLMIINRKSIEISLEHDEKLEAEFISSFFNEWKGIRQELLGYVRKMIDSWKTEKDIKEDLGYMG